MGYTLRQRIAMFRSRLYWGKIQRKRKKTLRRQQAAHAKRMR